MVVNMVAMLIVKPAVNKVIKMIAMWHELVSAFRTVHVATLTFNRVTTIGILFAKFYPDTVVMFPMFFM